MPQWHSSHVSPPPRTAFRSPIGSPTEISVAQFACVSPTQDSVSWPIGSSTECDTHSDGIHNCIWLGPSSG